MPPNYVQGLWQLLNGAAGPIIQTRKGVHLLEGVLKQRVPLELARFLGLGIWQIRLFPLFW